MCLPVSLDVNVMFLHVMFCLSCSTVPWTEVVACLRKAEYLCVRELDCEIV